MEPFCGVGRHAGPLGGRTQSTRYTIHSRFNKDALAERILNVKRLHDAGRIVGVLASRWQQSMDHARRHAALNDNPAATVVYLDPPHTNKADQIYKIAFAESKATSRSRHDRPRLHDACGICAKAVAGSTWVSPATAS